MKDTEAVLAREVRRAEKILGIDISIKRDSVTGAPIAAIAMDMELRGRSFTRLIISPARYKQEVRALHEAIYRERGQEVYRRQKGLCALCHKPMRGDSNTEIDHIASRGAHGRSDVISNLRVVHSVCHRARHDGKLKENT